MSRKHGPVDGKVIREKALSLYEHFSGAVAENERKGFTASKGWLAKYAKRFNLKKLKITREAASADFVAASTFPEEFKEIVDQKGYLPEQIFNCDETALFWKRMPKRAYIHKSAKQATGIKPLKDRLTLVLCGNAAGHMIEPGVVYRTRNPRSLRNKNKDCLPVFWQHNKKAWMTVILFTVWFNQCFISEAKKYLESKGMAFKVLLVIDNAPGRPQPFCFANENLEVKFLPANSTSLLQPLDQGAIKCLKATYTPLVFGKLRDTLHANPDCDLTGLWKRFSIADAINLVAEAVHEIKPRTVSGCWKRLWRDAVSECEDLGAIDEEVTDIVNTAKELGGEGFSDMIEDDIREHIEDCGEPFTNEELEELMQSPTGSDDDVMEDTEAQTPSDWTLQKLASIFRQAQVLKDMIVEYDLSMERGIMVTREITASLKPLQHLFDEAKKREKQPPITMLLNKAPAAAEPIILRREVSLSTSSRNPRTGRSPGDLRPPTESG
ncbi:hypothetical protein M514_05100 [Trichuris suis]|uniref:HTH CENPB-type domain-containing protein n=1 Tax=Trichuris suis TaxID=68888 RepID=A0A085NCP3_9BILA|nr:hypothetical protein M514_05100 [Trichuris suis]